MFDAVSAISPSLGKHLLDSQMSKFSEEFHFQTINLDICLHLKSSFENSYLPLDPNELLNIRQFASYFINSMKNPRDQIIIHNR